MPDLAQAEAILDAAGWRLGDDGLRYKEGLPARFRLTYPSNDTTRQLLAEVSADMVRPLGIEMQPTGRHWDEIQREALHQDAIMFGFGSHSPRRSTTSSTASMRVTVSTTAVSTLILR